MLRTGFSWFRDLLKDVDFDGLVHLGDEARRGEAALLFLPDMVGQRALFWN